jgi:hypothetical protein
MVSFGVPRGVGRFVERNEEIWDYFPDGFDRPGFRVGGWTRDRILSLDKPSEIKRLALFAGEAIAFGWIFNLARRYAPTEPFARSWIIDVALVALYGVVVFRIDANRKRAEVDRILKRAAPSRVAMSPQEAHELSGEATRAPSPPQTWVIRLALLGGLVYLAATRFAQGDAVSRVDGAIVGVVAAALVALTVRMEMRSRHPSHVTGAR